MSAAVFIRALVFLFPKLCRPNLLNRRVPRDSTGMAMLVLHQQLQIAVLRGTVLINQFACRPVGIGITMDAGIHRNQIKILVLKDSIGLCLQAAELVIVSHMRRLLLLLPVQVFARKN